MIQMPTKLELQERLEELEQELHDVYEKLGALLDIEEEEDTE